MSQAISVLYYHSIADHKTYHPKAFLSLPTALFKQQMHILKEGKFTTVTLQDVYDYVSGQRALTGPEVVLTFDDGFLDNWVTVWPLAQKMGFKFTIFVNPEFVDPRDIVRPTLDDVWRGGVSAQELDWWGYLSWAELRKMEASGLVDIQSHALTHTWYPASDEIIDFHHPSDSYFWLGWNHDPASKPFWLTEYQEERVPYGTPVYRFQKSLLAQRYLPDPALSEYLVQAVANAGGKHFFAQANWRDLLHAKLREARQKFNDKGRYEDESEREARIRHELRESKRRIEAELQKEVRYLCWPGGSASDLGRHLAHQEGYWATTKGDTPNRPGTDPREISRISSWFGDTRWSTLKWFLFQGQLDRASNRRTLPALITKSLSSANRLLASRSS